MKNRESMNQMPRKGISIGWKLVLYFAGFTAAALLVTWIFQVILLNTFFEGSKRRELLSATGELAQNISEDSLPETARRLAQNADLSILVYKIENGGI